MLSRELNASGKISTKFQVFLGDFLVVLETLNSDYGIVPGNKLLSRYEGQTNCLTNEFLMNFFLK